MTPTYRCCDTLNGTTAEPRVAGHHQFCPRFGLGAIEEYHAFAENLLRGTNEERARFHHDPLESKAHEHRAVLLTALREAQAALLQEQKARGEDEMRNLRLREEVHAERVRLAEEVQRLRQPERYYHVYATRDGGLQVDEFATEEALRASAWSSATAFRGAEIDLGPSGALASLPVDDDGAQRPGEE